MNISGVDLASRPEATAVARLDWETRRCIGLTVGADDDEVVATAAASDKCGIDAPFGWPDAFVEVVAAHHGSDAVHVPDPNESLRLRRTDIWVWRTHGRIPLSVSTDNIGVVALRAVRIQQRVAALTGPVDRTGGGVLAEVYPAAALKIWDLPHRGYKRGDEAAARRRVILDGLEARFDLAISPQDEAVALASHDALDALVSALIAGLITDGATTPVPPELREIAAREGWIHVPLGQRRPW